MDKRVQSYMGYDPGNGSDIVIEQAPPAARNGSIEYHDFGEGKSHKVRVMDIRRHRRSTVALELRAMLSISCNMPVSGALTGRCSYW